MKKIIFLFLLVTTVACDDGNLTIETLDFDSISLIQSCDDVSPTTANLLFKINQDEALILELPALAIQNELGTKIEFNVTSTGPTTITLRVFSDRVTTAYFCDDIPPIDPTVISEIIAEAGTVFITTTLDDDGETYTHSIELEGISLTISDDSRITDLSINEFGTVTTTIEE